MTLKLTLHKGGEFSNQQSNYQLVNDHSTELPTIFGQNSQKLLFVMKPLAFDTMLLYTACIQYTYRSIQEYYKSGSYILEILDYNHV
jgi:hypothetical protein